MGGTINRKQAAQEVQFQLTQKGIDFLGFRTLRHLLGAIGRSSLGSHDTPHLATGVEADAVSKPYEFGDSLNLDIPATLTNALARGGITVPLDLDYDDLMVHQAEYRSSCSTVVLLDISHSHDPVRRGSLHSCKRSRPRTRASHSYSVSRRHAARSAVSRFGRGDTARQAGRRRKSGRITRTLRRDSRSAQRYCSRRRKTCDRS